MLREVYLEHLTKSSFEIDQKLFLIQKKERFSKSRISGLDLTEEKNMPCVQGPRYVGDHSNQLTKISEQNF